MCTIFTDDARNAFADKLIVQAGEHALDFVGTGSIPSPVGGEPIPWSVSMNLYSYVTFHLVGRDGEVVEYIIPISCGVSIDNQVASCVVATSGTNCIYKALCISIQALVAVGILRSVPGVAGIEHLVIALKYQVLVIVLETGGNLCPEILKLLLVLLVVGFVSLNPVLYIFIVSTCIMVNIQDAVHPVINHVIYDFLYAVHPSLIYSSVSLHVLEPGNRNANRIETILLQKVNHRFGGWNLSPSFLEISNRVAVHVHPHGYHICAVAEVGTDAHVLHGIYCTFFNVVGVQVYLVAGNHVLAAQCRFPPAV